MANKTHNTAYKHRVLSILTDLLNSRFGITRQELMDKYNVNYSTIRRDMEIIEREGFVLEHDSNYRWKFAKNKEYKQLKDVLHFSEEERIMLNEAIDSINPNTSRALALKKKIESIYDLRQFGISTLSHAYLQKINEIQNAIEKKIVIILESYKSSNSNEIADRQVEVFHINTSEDIVHGFDTEIQELRNFKISRIKRIKTTDKLWHFENRHVIKHSDPFRITDDKMVMIHLRISIGAKNYLEEVYPLTKAYIAETHDPQIYDFQCRVNHDFIGLDNFIMGYHREIIEIVSPRNLALHIEKEIEKLSIKIRNNM